MSLGRWTTYKFVFNTKQNDASTYLKIKQALQDFNIEIVPLDRLIDVPARPAELWSLIDPSPSLHAAADLQDLEGGGVVMLPFEVRYQLEVCISREILNEHNLTKAFVEILSDIATKDSAKAQHILEYIAEQDKRVYNPMSIFEDKEALAYSSKSDIPHYCAYSRKATITPTTIYFNSPTVETTNRVLRHYSRENKDGRFLRVQFTDEMAEVLQLLSPASSW
jgi:RNA-dependent RNA polymerase